VSAKHSGYRPLGRARKGLFRSSRLWLGTDHLLAATSICGFESYRRYYLRDIQALLVRPTAAGVIKTSVLAVITLAFLVPAYLIFAKARLLGQDLGLPAVVVSAPAVLILSIPGLIFLLFTLITLARGLTCSVHLQTRPGLEPLKPLHYRRSTQRVLAELVPIITAAQAASSPAAPITNSEPELAAQPATPATP
jgi:hypothetical protein